MALTLGDGTTNLRTIVRSLCFEGTSDTGLFSSTQLDDFLNLAHREIYNEVIELSPSTFATRSSDQSITSSGLAISGTVVHANGINKVLKVELKDSSANYIPLAYIPNLEIGQLDGPANTVTGEASIRGWTLIGETLYLYPSPSTSHTIRLTHIPEASTLSATTDKPFGGSLGAHHDLVAYLAAVMALEKDEVPKFIAARYERKREQLIRFLRSRQKATSRTIHMTDAESTECPW